MNATDMGLELTDDGLDLKFSDGEFLPCDDLQNAVLLSLFGGNENDTTGRDGSTWWGNLVADTGDEKLVSRFQGLVNGTNITGANIKKAIQAAELDLAWLVDDGYVDEVEVSVSASGGSKAVLSVGVKNKKETVDGGDYEFAWGK